MAVVYRSGHPRDSEVLEEYVLGRLSESQTAALEEHLLLCAPCREALEQVDLDIRALKSVLAETPAAAPDARQPSWLLAWLFRPAGYATAGGVLALAVLIAVAGLHPGPSRDTGPVHLSSFRGTGVGSMADAAPGQPLDLRIDAQEASQPGECRIQVVDAAGLEVWHGAATPSGGELQVRVSSPLPAGIYWVRLYGPDAALIQEFGLRLK